MNLDIPNTSQAYWSPTHFEMLLIENAWRHTAGQRAFLSHPPVSWFPRRIRDIDDVTMFENCIVRLFKKERDFWAKSLWLLSPNGQNQNLKPFNGSMLHIVGGVSWRMIDSNCQAFAFEVKRCRKQSMQKLIASVSSWLTNSPTLQMKTKDKMRTRNLWGCEEWTMNCPANIWRAWPVNKFVLNIKGLPH